MNFVPQIYWKTKNVPPYRPGGKGLSESRCTVHALVASYLSACSYWLASITVCTQNRIGVVLLSKPESCCFSLEFFFQKLTKASVFVARL